MTMKLIIVISFIKIILASGCIQEQFLLASKSLIESLPSRLGSDLEIVGSQDHFRALELNPDLGPIVFYASPIRGRFLVNTHRSIIVFLDPNLEDLKAYYNHADDNKRLKSDPIVVISPNQAALVYIQNVLVQKMASVSVLVTSKAQKIVFYQSGLSFVDSQRGLEVHNIWRSEKQAFLADVKVQELTSFDFQGHSFQVVGMPNQFFVQRLADGNYVGSEVKKFGFLAEKLNFVMNITPSYDGKFGTLDPSTKEWNGGIAMLMRQEVDWCLGGYIVNYARSTVIDYANVPFCMIATGLNFLTSLPGDQPSWLAILLPFRFSLWMAVGGTCLLFGPVAYGLIRMVDDQVDLFHIYEWMSDFIFARGFSLQSPKAVSSFLVLTTWCIFAVVITLSYTSFLVSSLTFRSKDKPLETWDDVLASDFDIAFAFGTNEQLKIETATEEAAPKYFAMAQRVAKQDKDKTLLPFNPTLVQEHIQKHPKTVFLMTLFDIFPSMFPFDEHGKQVLHIAQEKDYSYYISLPFQKNWPYLDLFNRYFDRFFDMGIDSKLLSDATAAQKVQKGKGVEVKSNVVLVLGHLRGPFILYVIGLGLALLVFIYEVLTNNKIKFASG